MISDKLEKWWIEAYSKDDFLLSKGSREGESDFMFRFPRPAKV